MQKEGISFVIPILNEAENLIFLHKEIVNSANTIGKNFEIIFVNDGSTDNTHEVVSQLSPVKLINFRKKFGQTAALDAGINASQYGLIVTMDGDCQNDPADVPAMVEFLVHNNLDIVSGWRKNRKDSISKNFVSRVANLLRILLVKDGIHDSGCTLKVYKKECFDEVNLYGEMHRFIPGLLKLQGFKVGEIAVNHRPRKNGVSKYNWKRALKGLLDMISLWFYGKYAFRPLHLLGGIGFILLFLSFCFGLVSLYQYINGQDLSETFWPMLSLFTFLFAINFVIFGLIFDLLIKSYHESLKIKPYKIKSIQEYL